MKKLIRYIKDNALFVSLFLVAVILTFLIPNEGKFKYEYTRGRPWTYETLIAPVDFPILKNEAELNLEKSQKASMIVPYYNWSSSVQNDISNLLRERAENFNDNEIISFIDNCIQKIYEKGVVQSFPDSNTIDRVIIIQRNGDNIETPSSEVYTRKSAIDFLRSAVSAQFSKLDVNKLFNDINIEKLIVPNLILDKNATEIAHKNAIDFISPSKGMIYSGQLIVSKGEIVTAEIEQLLDSYKAEYEASMGYTGNFWLLKLGHFIFISGILVLLTIVLFFLKKEILSEPNKLYFILLLLAIIVIITPTIEHINVDFLFIIPYSVFALYLTSFFTSRIVVPIYMIFMLPVILIAQRGFEIYFMNVIAGSVAVYAFKFWNRGWLQFVNSLVVFFILSFSYLSFRLIEYGSFSGVSSRYFLYFLWNAVLVVAAYPLSFYLKKCLGLFQTLVSEILQTQPIHYCKNFPKLLPGLFSTHCK